jgi:opacity protein-like surface antigen
MAFALAACALVTLTQARTAVAQESLAIRGYFIAGSTWFAAADSFDAVAGKSRTSNIGGGVAVTFWRRAFVDVALSRVALDGQRVFVDQGTIYELNIPLQVTMIPFDVTAGWRASGRISPYGAVGLSQIAYHERSDFAGAGEDVDSSGTGWVAMAGADVALSRLLHAGGEFRYRGVDGALGETGVSEVSNERSIGGFSASIRISIGR